MVVRADPWNQEFQAARTWYLRIMMSICQSQDTSPVFKWVTLTVARAKAQASPLWIAGQWTPHGA